MIYYKKLFTIDYTVQDTIYYYNVINILKILQFTFLEQLDNISNLRLNVKILK